MAKMVLRLSTSQQQQIGFPLAVAALKKEMKK